MEDDENNHRDHLPSDLEGGLDYPDWWRKNVEEFQKHRIGGYRPPVFEDDIYAPVFIAELESRYDIKIQLRAINPQLGNQWQILVDGLTIMEIERRRESEGISIYNITSEELENRLEEYLSEKR